MKRLLSVVLIMMLAGSAEAQFSKATLQASGLTCSMCSKAVKEALDNVPFIEKVMVNIKTQEYALTFKSGMSVDFDGLSAAVEDAGFSIAALTVTAELDGVKAEKDHHVKIGDKYFHFLNGKGETLNGLTTFTIVDKAFVTEKAFKKYSDASKMACVKSGKAEDCCKQADVAEDARIYHVTI